MLISNKLKKILILFMGIIILFCTKSFAVVDPTKDFYVNDYANLLSEQTKQYIMETNIDLNQKTGAQIVVVTVKNLEGKPIEDYANELFRKFEIGDKTKNNGLLLLCSYEDRMFRVEVGYGLEGRLNDGKTGRMQDEYIIPYLKENKFDEGIKNGYTAFLQEVAKEYEVTVEAESLVVPKTTGSRKNNNGNFNFLIFPIFIIGSIFGMYIRKTKNKARGILIYLISIIIVFLISKFIIGSMMYMLMYIMISFFGVLIMFTNGSRRRKWTLHWRWRFWQRTADFPEAVDFLVEEDLLAEAEVQEDFKKRDYYLEW